MNPAFEESAMFESRIRLPIDQVLAGLALLRAAAPDAAPAP